MLQQYLHRTTLTNWITAVSACLLLIGVSAAKSAEPIADKKETGIYFGNSTVERYAAGELHRYLSRITGRPIVLRYNCLATNKLTTTSYNPKICQSYAIEIKRATAENEARKPKTVNKAPKPKMNKPSSGFVLGTPSTYPTMADKFKGLLSDIPVQSDGYCVALSDDGKIVYITGWNSRAVLYGVYDYLQNKAGCGFFEDGENVPDSVTEQILPPFDKPFKTIINKPKFNYRCQWIWTRYYGADRGHPANWGYEQWVSHLRWLAQRRFNSVLLYPVGYTRLWGDVHRRAFPETAPYDKEVWNDVEDFWGAHYSIMAGWGRSPQETTRLMQKVLKFGREQLGLKFEYNFYLGNFEETLQRVYPQGTWIDWTNLPHHAYFGAAGRSPTLAFTDPRSKEYNQRLWKTFIKTFGTDHRYWITYREESSPDPDNPLDPDKGKLLADAVNAQRKWILEIDPKAEFFHWDWHDYRPWFGPELAKKINETKDPNKLPWEQLRKASKNYTHALSKDITMVSVASPDVFYNNPPVKFTEHFEPHKWIIGSILGYAGQDVGTGGLSMPGQKFFAEWGKYVKEDKGTLQGVIHWDEIIQVNPLIDYLIGEFAWTGKTIDLFTDANNPNQNIEWYFEHRFGRRDGKIMMKCARVRYENFPQDVPTMRLPYQYTTNGISPTEKGLTDKLTNMLKDALSIRDNQRANQCYSTQLVDLGRTVLHTVSRLHLQQARAAALKQNRAEFEIQAKAAHNALLALADILNTDRRFCLSDSIYRMTNEPGANRLLRLMMLEHASGQLFGNYALNDTAEFIKFISVPLLDTYLENLRKTMQDPNACPIENANNLIDELVVLRSCFMNLPPQPFEAIGSKRRPSDILGEWLNNETKITMPSRAANSSVKMITCTPIVFGKPTPEYFPLEDWKDDEVEALFNNMEKDGINLIVLSGGLGDKVYFPSKILHNQLDYDGYGKIFDLAEEHGMQIMLSGVLYTFHLQFEGKQWDATAELEMNKRIFTELNNLYGRRSNFWGWYIPHEAGDRTHRGDVMTLLRALPPFLKHLTPDKPVAFSPWFTSYLTVGKDATTPEEFAAEWDAILSEVEGLDICAIQDSTAPYAEIGKWFAAAYPVFKKHNVTLWDVVELFYRDTKTCYADMTEAVSFPYLIKKIKAADPYVKGLACWEYQNYLNPGSPVKGAQELNKEYRAWYRLPAKDTHR